MGKELSPEVAKKYEVKGVEVGRYSYAQFGEIDLESITLEEADHLHRAKFPHLVLKKKATPPMV